MTALLQLGVYIEAKTFITRSEDIFVKKRELERKGFLRSISNDSLSFIGLKFQHQVYIEA